MRWEQNRSYSRPSAEAPSARAREADGTLLKSFSLLLLLLLLRKLCHGLSAKRLRPNHRRRRQFLRLRRIHRRNLHHHAQFTRRVALINSARWWHVRIIPPHRDSNVPLAPLQIIRGVKRHPSQIP